MKKCKLRRTEIAACEVPGKGYPESEARQSLYLLWFAECHTSDEVYPRRDDDLGTRYLACRTSDDARIWRRRRTRSRKLHRSRAPARGLGRVAHLGKNQADDR